MFKRQQKVTITTTGQTGWIADLDSKKRVAMVILDEMVLLQDGSYTDLTYVSFDNLEAR